MEIIEKADATMKKISVEYQGGIVSPLYFPTTPNGVQHTKELEMWSLLFLRLYFFHLKNVADDLNLAIRIQLNVRIR